MQADCGTENVYVAAIQRFFRNHHDDGMAGDSGLYFDNDAIQRECLKFCLIDILKLRKKGVANSSHPMAATTTLQSWRQLSCKKTI